MLKTRDIMTRELLTFAPGMTLREAAELLTERKVSGAPVVAGPRLVGVISASDILEFVAEREDDVERAREEDWADIDGDDGPAGFFEIRDDDGDEDLTQLLDIVREGKRDELDERTVEDVMTQSLFSMPSTSDVPAVADYMRRTGVHRILIVDDGQLVGIVSTMDVVRAVAEHKLDVRRLVFERQS